MEADGNDLVIDGKRIRVTAERDPANLPHKELGVDIVLECTGFFTDRASAQKHIDAGAKKVLISAPAKGVDITDEPTEKPYGVDFGIRDPLGNKIRIGSRKA